MSRLQHGARKIQRFSPSLGTSEDISRSYYVEYQGQFFAGWKGTNWQTVPRIATWTRNRKHAAQVKIDTVVERQDCINLVTGFSNTNLIAVPMEQQKVTTPKRKTKVWTTNL